MNKENFKTYELDEGVFCLVVNNKGDGYAVSNGMVIGHVIDNYVEVAHTKEQKEQQEKLYADGKMFVRDIPKVGSFHIMKFDLPVPIDTYIQASSERLGAISRGIKNDALYAEEKRIAQKHGCNPAEPADADADQIAGLKKLCAIKQTPTHELPIRDLDASDPKGPKKPYDRGNDNSQGDGRQRGDKK